MRKLLLLLLISLLVVICVGTSAHAITIVSGGKSDYSVVIPENAIPAEVFAADELVLHIREISGTDLKVIRDSNPLPKHAILLGNVRYLKELNVIPDWKGLGEEGASLTTKGDYLVIAGGRPKGTLYGVYDLLENSWGCRWFAPDTTRIPKRSTLMLPRIRKTVKPAFEFREPWIYSGWIRSKWFATHFAPDYVSRTRNSANQLNTHLFYKPIPGFEKYGGYFKIYKFGHNLSSLVPAEKYAHAHPEYYAFHDGGRVTEGDLELCLSNPDTAKVAAQTLMEWIRANPDSHMFFIGQSDTDRYCQCDRCKAARQRYGGADRGGFAGLNIEFVNRVAEIVEKTYPNAKIGTFAYSYTRWPPVNIKANKNVVVWFCPIERCFCHSIGEGPTNLQFYKYPTEIASWSKIAQKVYVYDYELMGALGQPYDLLHLGDSVRLYRKLGVNGIMVDSVIDIQAGFGFLRYWLWSKLLMDPNTDLNRSMDEFLDAYYGAAAPYIRNYIELVSKPKMYEPMPREEAAAWAPVTYEQLLHCRIDRRDVSVSAIELGYQLFEKAKSAVDDDQKLLDHVLAARMCLQYAMLDRLPSKDPRLKKEAASLLSLAAKLEMLSVQDIPMDRYRAGLGDQLGVESPTK